MAKRLKIWKLSGSYPVTQYACGVKAGQRVRLRRSVVLRDHKGTPLGRRFKAGEIWQVLPSSAEPPVVIWLRRPDGERHTWDDDASFLDYFEPIKGRARQISAKARRRREDKLKPPKQRRP